jgi:molybdopterin molybdotransferase
MEFLKAVTARQAADVIKVFPVTHSVERVPIEYALDRVLAEDIVSGEDIPPFPRSLVDGFAAIARNTHGAKETSPAFLQVMGEVKVGEIAQIPVFDGSAVLVSTGAMIPEGADAVIMEEYARRLPDAIEVTKSLHRGENICFAGEDIKSGQRVLRQGKRLSSFDLGVLAAIGLAEVPVYGRPEIALISSGDEIVGVQEKPGAGKIRDINRYTVSGLLEREGVTVSFLGIAGDSVEDIAEKLSAASGFNMILISAGSSKGERDFITAVIERLGGEIVFHGINIKPGKPTIFGKLWEKPIFGLPGHPNSCSMVTIRFVIPLVRRLKGEERYEKPGIMGVLSTNVPSSYGIEEYVRVRVEPGETGLLVAPIFAKSSVISSLSQASGYIVVPEGREGYESGEMVEVHLFE